MYQYSLEKPKDDFTIAMAYVPCQSFTKICENLENAYRDGSIFPELIKPFMGRRHVHGK